MAGIQLSWGYRATTRRQFTFYQSVSRNSRYSTDQLPNNEGWVDLGATSDFELGMPVLGIQRLNQSSRHLLQLQVCDWGIFKKPELNIKSPEGPP